MVPRWLAGSPRETEPSRLGQWLAPFGVLYRWRAAMALPLERLSELPRFPAGYSVIPWDPVWRDRLCEIDRLSYAGSIDAALYSVYFRTAAGSRRLWDEALRGRFGRFDPERTLLLIRGGEPRGHLMASMRSSREGFIGDLAVLPEDRGGTGRALLLECLWRYRRAGFQCVTLAVTLENQRALRLYESVGFTTRYKFPVMAWRPSLAAHWRASE